VGDALDARDDALAASDPVFRWLLARYREAGDAAERFDPMTDVPFRYHNPAYLSMLHGQLWGAYWTLGKLLRERRELHDLASTLGQA
jgi:hypothetical protein